MDNLLEKVREIASKAKDYKKRNILEPGTKSGLIEPLFREIGWDFSDVDCVEPEFQVKLDGEINPADYALKIDQKPKLLMEAKAINLAIKKAITDGTKKALKESIPWLIATNGNIFAVLKIDKNIPETERTIFQISLIDSVDGKTDSNEAVNYLMLLSPEKVSSGELNSFANDRLKRNRIINTIQNYLNSKDFEKAVKERYKKLYKDDQADLQFLKEIVEKIIVGVEKKPVLSIKKAKKSDQELIKQRQYRYFKHPDKRQKDMIKKNITDKPELWVEFIKRGEMSSKEFMDFSHFEPHAVAGFNTFMSNMSNVGH